MLRYSNLTAKKIFPYFLCFYLKGPTAEGKDDPQLRRFYFVSGQKRERKNGANKKIIEYNRMEKKMDASCFSQFDGLKIVAPLGVGWSIRLWEELKKTLAKM